ncbi:hypothetical protein LWI29_033135 [Acer saccharum]|uniref:Uncharacterized protein n=1 Tax=Acer saccharum TaxID=4024 RepID=A0AA39RSU4_ACESA|nr:hypothetical protein LWI29_033135 [Acer saccharum]
MDDEVEPPLITDGKGIGAGHYCGSMLNPALNDMMGTCGGQSKSVGLEAGRGGGSKESGVCNKVTEPSRIFIGPILSPPSIHDKALTTTCVNMDSPKDTPIRLDMNLQDKCMGHRKLVEPINEAMANSPDTWKRVNLVKKFSFQVNDERHHVGKRKKHELKSEVCKRARLLVPESSPDATTQVLVVNEGNGSPSLGSRIGDDGLNHNGCLIGVPNGCDNDKPVVEKVMSPSSDGLYNVEVTVGDVTQVRVSESTSVVVDSGSISPPWKPPNMPYENAKSLRSFVLSGFA